MGNKTTKPGDGNNSHEETDDDRDDTPSSGKGNPSYYTMAKNGYTQLVHAIIRPPRCDYETQQLGPKTFAFCGKTFERADFELLNPRNLKFMCSMWEPIEGDRPNKVLPCVIYMHGNSSSRLEALSALSLVLSLGATLLSLDFCGSGKSEGEYVSLGAFEKDDLQRVIEFLRATGRTSTIALWGRSMGAATALLHGERDPSIAGMVLDSAFADLVMLAEEMVDKGREKGLFAPGMLVRMAIRFVRSSVQKAAGFDIKQLSPIEHADKCFIPAMFIAAENDNFVSKQHSIKIHERYGGDKNIVIVDGDHNSARPFFLFDSIAIFLVTTLQIPNEWILPEGQSYTRKYPWTYKSRHQAQLQYERDLVMSGAHSVGGDDDDEDAALQDVLALSLMEAQESASHSHSSDHEKHMATDTQMQQETQSKLYNLLGGLKTPPPPTNNNTKHNNSHNSHTNTSKPPVHSTTTQERLHNAALDELGVAPQESHSAKYKSHNQSFDSASRHSPHHNSASSNNNSGSGKSHFSFETVPSRPVYSKSDSTEMATREMLNQNSCDLEDEEEERDALSSISKSVSSNQHSPSQQYSQIHAHNQHQTHNHSNDFDVVSVQAHPRVLKDHKFGQDSSFNKLFSAKDNAANNTNARLQRESMTRQQTLTEVDMEGLGSVDEQSLDQLKLGHTPCSSSDSKGGDTTASDMTADGAAPEPFNKQDSFGFDAYGDDGGEYYHQHVSRNSNANNNYSSSNTSNNSDRNSH